MISASLIEKRIRNSRHRQRGTVTTFAPSATEVDSMNRPVMVPTTRSVVFIWHPTAGTETNDDRQVSKARRTAYLPACSIVGTTGTLTHAGLSWEIVDIQAWGVGTVLLLERTV